MPKITALKPQRRRGDRANLYIDNAFCAAIPLQTIESESLSVGLELTDSQLQQLLVRAEAGRARQVLIDLLSRRNYSEQQLSQRLTQRGFSPAAAEQGLDRMRELGLVDDRAFAQERAQRLRDEGYGPPALSAKLRQAGFPPTIIQDVMAEVLSDQDELAAAEKALLARFPQPPSSARERQRAQQYLSRRGWGAVSWEVVKKWARDTEVDSHGHGEGITADADDFTSSAPPAASEPAPKPPNLDSILRLVDRREPERAGNPTAQRRAYALCRRRGIDHDLALRIARGEDVSICEDMP